MKKYITSDKVGEFCQAMSNAGVPVSIDNSNISVCHCDGSCTFIGIYQKSNFENLVSEVLGTEASLRSQKLFDESHPTQE